MVEGFSVVDDEQLVDDEVLSDILDSAIVKKICVVMEDLALHSYNEFENQYEGKKCCLRAIDGALGCTQKYTRVGGSEVVVVL